MAADRAVTWVVENFNQHQETNRRPVIRGDCPTSERAAGEREDDNGM
jgi:hypothetical protein